MATRFTRPGRQIQRQGLWWGTIGAIVHANDGFPRMLTANHVVENLSVNAQVSVNGWSPSSKDLAPVLAIVTSRRSTADDLVILAPTSDVVCSEPPLGTAKLPALRDDDQIQVGLEVLIYSGESAKWYRGQVTALRGGSNQFQIQMYRPDPADTGPDLDFDTNEDRALRLYKGASGSPVYAWRLVNGVDLEIQLAGIVLEARVGGGLVAVDPGPFLNKFGLSLEDFA